MTHPRPPVSVPRQVSEAQRVEAFVREHYAFVWRVLRRYGLAPADADDGAQKVFLVATQRVDDIACGSERAFLFRTARHVASKAHRTLERRRDAPGYGPTDPSSTLPAPDDLLDQRRARDLLDRILLELPEDFRAVLVLFEIEGMLALEVADALGVPVGTVASRLRRARAEVEKRAARHLSRRRPKGSDP
jgi:RNA polymerase sigma-70 factor (ECF subfamily)